MRSLVYTYTLPHVVVLLTLSRQRWIQTRWNHRSILQISHPFEILVQVMLPERSDFAWPYHAADVPETLPWIEADTNRHFKMHVNPLMIWIIKLDHHPPTYCAYEDPWIIHWRRYWWLGIAFAGCWYWSCWCYWKRSRVSLPTIVQDFWAWMDACHFVSSACRSTLHPPNCQ